MAISAAVFLRFLASEILAFALPPVLPNMGNRKKVRTTNAVQTDLHFVPHVRRQHRRFSREDDGQFDPHSKPAAKKHKRPVRCGKAQKTTSLADTVRAVIAVYPEAIFEWPDGTCSISEFPKGPEISRRYRSPQRAWINAARACSKATKTRRVISTRFQKAA